MSGRSLLGTLLVLSWAIVVGIVPAGSTPPGDNGKIVFLTHTPRSHRALFSIEPDGSDRTLMTDEFPYYLGPAWSHDGTQLAYVQVWRKRGMRLQIADADAALATTVLTSSEIGRRWDLSDEIAWMPDGDHLVITLWNTRTGSKNLFTIATDGTGRTRLTPKWRDESDPAVSHDGTTIAFIGGDSLQLSLMGVDGSDRRVVGPAGDVMGNPDWAPDDRSIAFDRYQDGQWDLYTIAPDGSSLTQITDTPRSERNPSFSPDGTLIAFERSVRVARESDLWLVGSDGHRFTRLTDTPKRWEEDPAWQPLVAI